MEVIFFIIEIPEHSYLLWHTVAKFQSQPRCPSVDIWIRKLERYSTTKKKETRLLGQETELQITLLVEICQTQKTNIRVFSHMCNLVAFK